MKGTTLANKYDITQELFTDKLGTAFGGTHVADGYGVLVHVLDKSVAVSQEQLDQLFGVAARVRDIQSPTLAPAIDSGTTDDGSRFIVTALPESVTLGAFAKGGLTLPQALDLSFQLATGLGVAAQEGIAHKALSADTVLVSTLPEGGLAAHVVGWGYDALLPEYASGQKDERFHGTPEYMPPEVCSGKGWSDQADIYSLGILMYQMITGKPPFISSNFNTTLKRQIYEKPLPLHLLKRGIVNINEFEKVVFRALQKLPPKRTEGFDVLAQELREFRDKFAPEDEFTSPRPPSWPVVLGGGGTAAPAAAAAPEPEEEPAPARSETMMFTGIGQMAEAERAVEEAAADDSEEGDTLRMGEAEAAAADAPESEPEPMEEPQPEPEPESEEQLTEERPTQTAMFEAAQQPEPAPEPEPEAEAAPKAAPKKGEGSEEDEDWFVESPQELEGRELTESWADRKQPSNVKFYVIAISIAVVVVAALVYLFTSMGDKPTPTAQKTPSAEAQRKAEADKAAEARRREKEKREQEMKSKADEEKAKEAERLEKLKEQARIAAENEKKRKEQEEADAKRLAEAALKEGQQRAHKAQEELFKFNDRLTKYREDVKTKKAQWDERTNLVKVGEMNKLLGELGTFQTRSAEIIVPESGKGIEEVVSRMETLQKDFEAFAARVDTALAEDLEAPASPEATDDAAAKAAEEAAAKAAEEAAAAKAAEEAAAKAAEEAAAAKAAEEAAAKAAADAEKKKKEEEAKKKAEAGKSDAEKKADAEKKKKEEAEKKKAAAEKKKKEEEAKKKAAAEKKKKEEEAKKATAKAADLQKDGMKAMKDKNYDGAISLFKQAKAAGGNAALLNKLIAKAEAEKKAAGPSDEEKKKKEEEAKKKAEADAKKKEEEAKKKAEADAKKKEEEAKKKAEAEKKKKEEEAKKKAEADAKKKEEEAKKKAEAEKKKEESKDSGKADHLQKMGMKAMKAGNKKLAIKYFEKAKSEGGNAALLDKLIQKCQD